MLLTFYNPKAGRIQDLSLGEHRKRGAEKRGADGVWSGEGVFPSQFKWVWGEVVPRTNFSFCKIYVEFTHFAAFCQE